MKILIVGGGGREHALAWRLAKTGGIEVLAAPGNPGIAKLAQCFAAPESLQGYLDLALAESVDLTVVGPEATLVAGIVDLFRAAGLAIVGPTKKAAQLEGSKKFAKQFFADAFIPTARCVLADNAQQAHEALQEFDFPVVIKADGLAAGKGVVIAQTEAEANRAIEHLGPALVIEEFLQGEEISFIGLSDGKTIVPFEASQDHKRVYDGDQGPNTGGMGAYSQPGLISTADRDVVMDTVMLPAIYHMAESEMPFTGFLYAGLMMTAAGPKVLEFNVRLGDPETQALLYRLESGLPELLQFSAGLAANPSQGIRWSSDPAVCVVLSTAGYPDKPRTGDAIKGLEQAETNGSMVFHAGTRQAGGELLTSGGRVLGITAKAATLKSALDQAYIAVEAIHFDGMHYRRDIGQRGLAR